MEGWTQRLDIGCTGDEPWDEMHVSQVRYLTFTVKFRERPGDGEPDLRHKLAEIWRPLLEERNLSAFIGHQSWHPERGLGIRVNGFVWRHKGRERFESLTDEEILQLRMMLVENCGRISGYSLTELVTGERRGNFDRLRRWRLDDEGYSETEFQPVSS